jgi:hypothetical protein
MRRSKASSPLELRLHDDYSGMSPAQIEALKQEIQTFVREAARRLGGNAPCQTVEFDHPLKCAPEFSPVHPGG